MSNNLKLNTSALQPLQSRVVKTKAGKTVALCGVMDCTQTVGVKTNDKWTGVFSKDGQRELKQPTVIKCSRCGRRSIVG